MQEVLNPILPISEEKWTWARAQVAEHLLVKWKVIFCYLAVEWDFQNLKVT